MGELNLDDTVVELKDDAGTVTNWTIRDSFEGTQIFGGIGSGKTSGSGRTFAIGFLKKGYGGLVLTAKNEEKDLWIGYCKATNRSDDLIIVEPGSEYYFNFLQYEAQHSSPQFPVSQNIVQVLKTVIRASEEKNSGTSDDPFWETALDMLIYNCVELSLLAFGTVTVETLNTLALSAPKKSDDLNVTGDDENIQHTCIVALNGIKKQIKEKLERWKKGKPLRILDTLSTEDFDRVMNSVVPEAQAFAGVERFFIDTYRNLSERTRSIIEFSFLGFLSHLMREPLYSLFSKYNYKYTPDVCLKGKIILLNLPVKSYYHAGRDCQILFKYIWQRAMERRDIKNNPLPVFLFADEAQHFLHEYDAEYQATARGSMIATLYITQNLPNYHANMGGTKSEYRVKSFLGTLATKIFHANADIETNKYASDLVGDAYRVSKTKTRSYSGDENNKFNMSEAESKVLEKAIRPEKFGLLRTGGPRNDKQVDALIHTQGNTWPEQKNYAFITFNQNNKTNH